MDRQERNKVLIASLRVAPVGTPMVELAETEVAKELLGAWSTGHPAGALSLTQDDR